MNMKKAWKLAMETWKHQFPVRAFSFSAIKGVLMVPLSNTEYVLVVHNNRDLWRLRTAVDMAIQQQENPT